MKIQWVCYEEDIKNDGNMNYSGFGSLKSLDNFDLNIFDLSDERFWASSNSYGVSELFMDNDLAIIKRMITNSSKTKILVILPQNEIMNYGTQTRYLKNMLFEFQEHLNKIVELPFRAIEFERTDNKINNHIIPADFYFLDEQSAYTKSLYSEKITTVSNDNKSIFFTSLNLNMLDDTNDFLREVGLYNNKVEEIPKWMGGIDVFDDKEQNEAIEISLEKIKEQQKLIDKSNEILEQNKRYKSILYTQGDELVEVIFDMIEEMLEINLSEFVDERKEDIGFKIGDEYFIGEIKGIADNVKAGRLSQLDNHLYHFMEKNENIPEENIRRLLIVNHQRKRPLNDRDPIDINQINLAINKYGSLIIETSELLKLFEKFRNKEISKNEVIKLFQKTGKLTIG